MSRWLILGMFFSLGLISSPLMAQDTTNLVRGVAAVGMGLTILGVGLGIGRIGGSACESIARQPEMQNKIQGAMILAAALIEGAAFVSLLFCFLVS